jgi:hypothetical protein
MRPPEPLAPEAGRSARRRLPANAPAKCPRCGATLTARVVGVFLRRWECSASGCFWSRLGGREYD